jgi:oligoribonuclease (3'-5' exoribonuclease)
MLRISDLEGRLSLMKRQAKTAIDQASKSYGLMKQVSVLEDKVSGLVAQVIHLKECDSFLIDFIESACEQLKCKFLAGLL